MTPAAAAGLVTPSQAWRDALDPIWNLGGMRHAVRKAPGRRLVYDLAHAAAILQEAAGHPREIRHAYLVGAYNGASSLTLRAAILTAWGL